MKVGVSLPQFRADGEAAISAARVAERAGVDGVFVFDHLWPLGRPDQPALAAFPLLGALAAETEAMVIGTLVARVGLIPDSVLVHNFASLQRMVGDRLVAGLGTGDRLSEPENRAYSIAFAPAAERLAALGACCRELRAMGVVTWVGGRSAAIRAVAGADADALNLWEAAPAEVVQRAAETAGASDGPATNITWGGAVPADEDDLVEHLMALRAAGATWAVCAPVYGHDPGPAVERVGRARRALG